MRTFHPRRLVQSRHIVQSQAAEEHDILGNTLFRYRLWMNGVYLQKFSEKYRLQ